MPAKGVVLRELGRDLKDPSQEVTFAEFVEVVSRQQPERMDKHWCTQFIQSFAAFCKLDFVGKLERLDEDILRLSHASGLNLNKVGRYMPHQTGSNERLSEFYTADLADKVFRAYHQDFAHFNYDSALPM